MTCLKLIIMLVLENKT